MRGFVELLGVIVLVALVMGFLNRPRVGYGADATYDTLTVRKINFVDVRQAYPGGNVASLSALVYCDTTTTPPSCDEPQTYAVFQSAISGRGMQVVSEPLGATNGRTGFTACANDTCLNQNLPAKQYTNQKYYVVRWQPDATFPGGGYWQAGEALSGSDAVGSTVKMFQGGHSLLELMQNADGTAGILQNVNVTAKDNNDLVASPNLGVVRLGENIKASPTQDGSSWRQVFTTSMYDAAAQMNVDVSIAMQLETVGANHYRMVMRSCPTMECKTPGGILATLWASP